MREREVEKHLVDRVKEIGGLCWKFTSPGTAGVPDRIVILPWGKVVFVELKAPNGKLRPIQVVAKRVLEEKQANYECLCSKEEVDMFIIKEKRDYVAEE